MMLFGTLLPVSCSRSGAAIAEMERAEALMDSLPDSALAIMRGIDPRSLHGSEARALYALTMSRALDRNDIPVASDSIIAPAVGHFRPDRDPLRHTMTQYYLGRTLFHAGDYGNSIIAYLEGLETAKNDSLFFWAGMNARGVMQNFNRTDNGSQELEYAELSYDNFRITSKKMHTLYAQLDLGASLFNCGNEDEALKVFDDIERQSLSINDSILWAEAVGYKIKILYLSDRYGLAIKSAKELINNNMAQTQDSVFYAMSLAQIGDLESAKKLSVLLDGRIPAYQQSLNYKIFKAENQLNNAMKALEKINENNYDEYFNRYKHDLSFDIIGYYDQQQKLKGEALKTSNKLLNVFIILIVLCCAFVVILYMYYRNLRNRQEEHSFMMTQELKRLYSEREKDGNKVQTVLFDLLRRRYELIDEMCQSITSKNESEAHEKVLSKKISRIIKSFVDSSEGFEELEKIANQYCGNIFSDFRRDLPSATEKEYHLYVLSALRFSPNVIALFMSESRLTNVYNRKRHLRDKIKELEPTLAVRYLSLID